MHAFPMNQRHTGVGNARVNAGFPCVMAAASWSRTYLTIDHKPEPRRPSPTSQ
jgi:hypothetical protein